MSIILFFEYLHTSPDLLAGPGFVLLPVHTDYAKQLLPKAPNEDDHTISLGHLY